MAVELYTTMHIEVQTNKKLIIDIEQSNVHISREFLDMKIMQKNNQIVVTFASALQLLLFISH